MPRYDVIVVGGGAAGLLCAGTAAARGRKVLVLEKMERPARKILVTGKGRCNLTNNCTPEELRAAVKANPRFLYSAFSVFSAQDTMNLFEQLGVPLKTERGGRVFPVSDKAMDIADALVRYAKKSGAEIKREEITALWIKEGSLHGVIAGKERYAADNVVLATGGKSYPGTGSTGDGYRFAAEAGHEIISPRPSLIPIETNESWCADAMGLSLKNITLTVLQQGKKKPVFSSMGELLFTHFGVSGPLVLSASAHMTAKPGDYKLLIDLKPALAENELDARILRDFEQYKNKYFRNALDDLLPRALIPVIIANSGIAPEAKVHQITRAERQALITAIKALTLTPKSFRPIEEAVVTAGGVKTLQVDPKTMQSKLMQGLFFAGELLDVDAYTGGYNLQIAFSTGYVAGMSV